MKGNNNEHIDVNVLREFVLVSVNTGEEVRVKANIREIIEKLYVFYLIHKDSKREKCSFNIYNWDIRDIIYL